MEKQRFHAKYTEEAALESREEYRREEQRQLTHFNI